MIFEMNLNLWKGQGLRSLLGSQHKCTELPTPYAVHDYSYQECSLHTEDQNHQQQKHRMHNYFLIVV